MNHENCCVDCGCFVGDDSDCPVFMGTIKQNEPCFDCPPNNENRIKEKYERKHKAIKGIKFHDTLTSDGYVLRIPCTYDSALGDWIPSKITTDEFERINALGLNHDTIYIGR